MDLRVVVELVLLDMIRFDVIGEGRRKLTVFFGKNVFVDFLQDPFPVQIRITNDIGPTYVQLAFIAIWFLQEYLHGRQQLQHNITNELIFLVVIILTKFVHAGC